MTRMPTSVSAVASTVAAIPVMTTTEEQRKMNDLFYYAWTANRGCCLPYVIKLMQQVANGAVNRAIVQGIDKTAYFQTLMTLPDDPHVNIDAVTFDATQPASEGSSLLYYWSTNGDLYSADQVRITFELLQRSGGVTLKTALSNCPGTLTNVYAMALNSDNPYWVNCLLNDSTLDSGWSVPTTRLNRTPLMYALDFLRMAMNESVHHILAVTSDDAINACDSYGTTALDQTITIGYPLILEALLLRPSLNMSPSLRSATHLQSLSHCAAIISVFDKVAQVFDVVPLLIHNTLYTGFKITLPLPVCTIIYHYYRMPYPICECDPALLAAAPTKHSPFCFCFPPP